MPEPTTLALFAAASFALVVIPGPNLIYIITRSLAQGTVAGLVSAAGVETATFVYVAATAFGVSEVLARSDLAFGLVRYAGAAYLLFLAVQTLRHPLMIDMTATAPPRPLGDLFRDGAVVNLLNPKVALFFVAFLPQFVDSTSSTVSPQAQLIVLGSVFLLVALVLDIGYALAAGGLAAWLRRRGHQITWLRWPVATVYLGLACYAVLGT